jgi:hypothetical protein
VFKTTGIPIFLKRRRAVAKKNDISLIPIDDAIKKVIKELQDLRPGSSVPRQKAIDLKINQLVDLRNKLPPFCSGYRIVLPKESELHARASQRRR